MIELYQTPRKYLSGGSYKTLAVEGLPQKREFSDLELAIIGFIALSKQVSTQETEVVSPEKDIILPGYVHSRSYSELMELIFEFLKLNRQEKQIRELIRRNIGVLERELQEVYNDERIIETDSSGLRENAEKLCSGFRQLRAGDIDSISYNKLNPSRPKTRRFIGPHITPFGNYSRRIIKRLINDEIALKYIGYDYRGRKAYLTINPNLRVNASG